MFWSIPRIAADGLYRGITASVLAALFSDRLCAPRRGVF
jgi:hypothetical protein